MKTPRIGVIGIPGKWSTEILADALQQRTAFRQVIDMAEVSADLLNGRLLAGGHNLCELDGLVVKKISQQYSASMLDRLEMLRIAENQGVRVFSSAEKILRMVDRMACSVTLANAGIDMPPTIITESPDEAFKAVDHFSSAVFKPLFSTKARGMCVINAGDAARVREQINAFQKDNPVMYIQQKLNLQGQDYGMVFLGGRFLGSYARVGEGNNWSTVVNESGGRYLRHVPDPDVIEMANKSQALFGMDFTTVDIADSEQGPVVFEVSAFGGFRGAHEGIGIDAAGMYADYLVRQCQSRSTGLS